MKQQYFLKNYSSRFNILFSLSVWSQRWTEQSVLSIVIVKFFVFKFVFSLKKSRISRLETRVRSLSRLKCTWRFVSKPPSHKFWFPVKVCSCFALEFCNKNYFQFNRQTKFQSTTWKKKQIFYGSSLQFWIAFLCNKKFNPIIPG